MPNHPVPSSVTRRVAQRHPVESGLRTPGIAALSLNVASADEEIASDVSSLQSTLEDLQESSTFSDIYDQLSDLDADINEVLDLLEGARQKGYVYHGEMEDLAYKAIDRWETVRPQVEQAINRKAKQFQTRINTLAPHVERLNAVIRNPISATTPLDQLRDKADQMLWDLESDESDLRGQFSEVETTMNDLKRRLTRIHWGLEQLDEATFETEKNELLYHAVSARWDKEGKDDPEGILYLTNQRLIFEQKEKVATKKILFIATEKELVQQVLIDQPLEAIEEVETANKGLFGHHDFIDVTFADSQVGNVSLHLDGQDSKKWLQWIDHAKSGQLEDERVAGTGVSIQDMTGPLTKADLMALQSEVNALQDEMMLKPIYEDISALENEAFSLERTLADLRARGYAVEKSLEADIRVLLAQWERIKARAETAATHQAQLLSERMTAIQDDMAALMGMADNLSATRPQFVQLKSNLASAKAQAEAAEATALDQYDEYADEVESLAAHFDWVDWMLDALSSASFRLLATESAVAAVEAVWERPNFEPENGILYLTDQRILWEDRVGDFELKVDVSVDGIADVKKVLSETEDTEMLEIQFDGDEAPVHEACFLLSLPVAETWLQMIGRARAGDYLQDRAIEIDESTLERVRNAPEQCSNCGAAFTAPILRGQQEIVCEYCGVRTRF
jgi:predicted  nucleic acid-binding Zn-ribbon protein